MREVLVFQCSGILNNSNDTDSLRSVGLLLKSSLTWTANCWNFPKDKHRTYGIKVTGLGPQLVLFLTLQVIYVFTFFSYSLYFIWSKGESFFQSVFHHTGQEAKNTCVFLTLAYRDIRSCVPKSVTMTGHIYIDSMQAFW